jgi:hypothetical protein
LLWGVVFAVNLEQCLFETDTSHLRAIAEFRQLGIGANPSRADVISILRQNLLNEKRLKSSHGELNAEEKEILYQLREAGGSIPVNELEKSWGCEDAEVARRWFWHRTVNRGLARLRLTGLLYCIRDHNEDTKVYVLPKEFHTMTCMPVPEINEDDNVPYQYVSTGCTILGDIYYYLQYLTEYRVRMVLSGQPAKRHKPAVVKKLETLTHSDRARDEKYVDLLFALADQLGFILRRRHILDVDSRVTKWFDRSQIDQITDLYKAWINLGHHNETFLPESVTLTTAGLQHPYQRVKRSVTGVAGLLPTNKWVKLTNISSYFKHNRPYFFRSDLSPGLWRLRDNRTDQIIPDDNVWDYLEYSLIMDVTTRQLAWLGLIDVGLDKQGNPEALLLNPLGCCVINNIPTGPGDMLTFQSNVSCALNKVVIQPDFEILAPAGIVLAVRNKLDKIAEVVSGGHMQKYRVNRNTIASALESGLTGDEIIEFLENVSHSALPQNVRISITDWIREYGKIEIRKGVVMSADDQYLMKEITAQNGICQLAGKVIGSRAVWVPESNVAPLTAELKRLGYLPRIDQDAREKDSLALISLKLDLESVEHIAKLLNEAIRRPDVIRDKKKHSLTRHLIETLDAAMER